MRLVICRRLVASLMPPDVAALGPVDVVASAAHDEHVLHRLLHARTVAIGEGHVDGRLERQTLPLRQPLLAVITSFALASSMPARRLSAEKPPYTTEWIAPRRATASIAAIASGIIGM